MLIRKLSLTDDLIRVGELIYATDPYVYPAVTDDVKQGAKLFASLIKSDSNYFCVDNIVVAEVDNAIIGVLIYSNSTKFWATEHVKSVAAQLDIPLSVHFHYLCDIYFSKSHTWFKSDTAYISNLSVLKSHRGKGIGSALLDYVLTPSDKSFTLDTLAYNTKALNLYARKGFHVTDKVFAFTLDDSYTHLLLMHRPPSKPHRY